MATGLLGILAFLAAAVLFVVAVVAGWWIIVRVLSFIGAAVMHVARWIGGTVSDLLRLVGAAIVGVVFVPLILANVIIGRWSAASHYGRALSAEGRTIGACVYRVAIGHPARLLGLHHAVEGLERRLPNAVAHAPTSDKPKRATGLFEGFTIVGSLKGGGSGGKLYIAEPDAVKQAGFERRGYTDCDRVVIKTFSLTDGSSLPQIVRESRALDAARKMGLVLEHELTDERFFYVMKYVPGDSLAVVTQQLHAESSPTVPQGLDDRRLRTGLGFVADLLENLDVYHSGGLWHKDVKPDNIIIDPRDVRTNARDGGRAHLVDFGLITPLRSAMTLTTHGTEYFRDPELVRMALRGVKVHQIDGARFDVYAAGAVLYSVIENQFPAHGGLSRVEKRCPEALRWVIRRAMTDYDKRYRTARAMLADLEVVLAAADPFAVKPAELPSMKGIDAADDTPEAHEDDLAAVPIDPVEMPEPEQQNPLRARAARPTPAAEAAPAANPATNPATIRVANWWTGRVARDAGPEKVAQRRPAAALPRVAPGDRAPAADQLKNARERAAARRDSARARLSSRRNAKPEQRGMGPAVGAIAVVCFIVLGVAAALLSNADARSAARAEATARAAVAEARAEVEAEVERIAQADIDEQLDEAERQLREAFEEAGTVARGSIEAALRGIRETRRSLGLGEFEGDRVTAVPPAPAAPPQPGDPHQARATPPSRLAPFAAGPLAKEGARVAFLSDFRPPLSPELTAQTDGVIGLMEGAGADVFGELTDAPNDPAQAGREIALIAELRHARAQAPLTAPSTGLSVQSIVAQNDDVDAVVWISPDDARDGRLRLFVSTADRSSTAVSRGLHPGLFARYALPGMN